MIVDKYYVCGENIWAQSTHIVGYKYEYALYTNTDSISKFE